MTNAMTKWARILYQPNLPLEQGKYVTACKEHIELSKQAAGEGMVLLKNEKSLLPLQKGCKIALFGKGSFDYVKGGGGSGDVTTAYVRNIYEGFKELKDSVQIYEPVSEFYKKDIETQYASGAVPGMTVEPEIPETMVKEAKDFADVAVVVFSRFSGEGWDRSSTGFKNKDNPWESETSLPELAVKLFPKSDYYLTEQEEKMLSSVKQHFSKIVVVLNVGGIVDTTWIKNDENISSALMAWQGGMEGGLAMAEVLTGIVNPSGKLTDTFANDINDYPSTYNFHESPFYVDYTEDIYVGYRYFETIPDADKKVCYPFGYGLSYTTFALEEIAVKEKAGVISVSVKVTNTGKVPGKEVVQVYTKAPQGLLKKPAKELKSFAKTSLLQPGESQVLEMSFMKKDMASYDDLGKVAKSAYILEKGNYEFYVGCNVRDAQKAGFELVVDKDEITEQLSAKMVPSSLSKRMLSDGSFEELPQTAPYETDACIFETLKFSETEGFFPAARGRDRYFLMKPYAENAKPLMDVVEGKISLDEFIAQLSDDDLIHLLGGQPNIGVSNTCGIGNIPEYGIPSAMTEDGPAGVRIHSFCGVNTTAWPCATALASTWDISLVEKIGEAGGKELKENNLAIWLTPALNIHRSPLCGRNFEYYSEDPLISGKMAAALTRGIQSQKVAACGKHFACNNKETNRKNSDSRVSERAAREIYLKGFEILVKEADPWVLMSSYNIINGHRASEYKDMLDDILRGEWGYKGLVVTDWWNRAEHYKEILAGNDVKMACGFPERVKKALELGAITRNDLIVSAKRVLEMLIKLD